jgi:acetylornithine/succinyldiaminopimelate/putrescine aminotransferase/predicted amino acid dehydrogenase
MTASELLSDLRGRGVRLWVAEGELRYGAPKGALGREATQLLAQHKIELIELLKAQPPDAPVAPQASRAARTPISALERRMIDLAALPDWNVEEQVSYIRYVAPYRSFLYRQLGLDRTFVRGEGCSLIDECGTRYADFVAQFGAVPFGHDPQAIWEAIDSVRREGRPNLAIASISPVAGELAERLLAVAPPGLAHVVFTNSGAECVEAALKLARCRTNRLGVLSTRNGFHGLTLAGMSATDKEFFQSGFGAPVAGFNYVAFGALAALQSLLELRPDYFAAFLIEPIQGESGIHVVPPGYLAAAHALCRHYGVLLVVDEVQTGLGRTGQMFACAAEGVTPDILLTAKALGGGLMPVGACLYTHAVFSEQFDLRHGSTFAGNTLACRAALATLDELTKNDSQLIRQVAKTGESLQSDLLQLQRVYPELVKEIRGRGLMLGVELDLDHVGRTQSGLLAILQQQDLLLYLSVSYLLNVEHVRIAASFTQGNVLRIEPPLIADAALCEQLIRALRNLLHVLRNGDTGALLGHLMGITPMDAPRAGTQALIEPSVLASAAEPAQTGRARFAFVVHLLGTSDLRRFDRSLESGVDDAQLEQLRARIAAFIRPFPHGRISVSGADDTRAEGELIVLPHLPAELLALSGKDALGLVQEAVDLAAERGATVVGLGGFSSIVAGGGLSVQAPAGLQITSGNSLTTWAALRAVERACADSGPRLGDSTVAVVGATGAIGQALSLLFAEHAAKLILIGNPNATAGSLGKLHAVARDCERHAVALGRSSVPAIEVTTRIDDALPNANVVLAATNAVAPFIAPRHLRQGAVVCDISRPFNLTPGLEAERPDVRIVGTGLVRAPPGSSLGHLGERDQPDVLVACAAETIVLALSRFASPHLCGSLDVTTIAALGRLSEALGFSAS